MTVLAYSEFSVLSVYQLQLVEPWNCDGSWLTVQIFHVEDIVVADTISGFNIVYPSFLYAWWRITRHLH